MNIAIIPARAGSKRIKNKNIKDFCGAPIISYAIKCAQDSKIFDEIIVSTDSDEIQSIAKTFGAKSNGLRPENLSDDFATTLDVMSYEARNFDKDDVLCCIYPTTPLLNPKFLKEAYKNIPKNAYCFSACAFNSNPLRGFFIKNNELCLLNEHFINSRSQDLDEIFYDAGQFYFGHAETFFQKKSIFGSQSVFVVLPQINVVDINTQSDWELAEIKYKILCKQ